MGAEVAVGHGAADGAGLRLRAGGVRPTVPERFAVRLSAAGAGHRRFAVRIDPFMTERAALRGTASAADAGFCACRFAEVMPRAEPLVSPHLVHVAAVVHVAGEKLCFAQHPHIITASTRAKKIAAGFFI